jgi:uncharacterized protein (DUF1697 family)
VTIAARDGRVNNTNRVPDFGNVSVLSTVTIYVALLRGINVGGNNLIRMPALKACFEAEGYRGVSTYIQSGNVLFTSDRASRLTLTREIEKVLSKTFSYESRVVLRSFEQMKRVVERAPGGFGSRPAEYRYDVIFLKEPLTAEQAMRSVTAKPGVDRAVAGDGVLYFSRLIAKASQSQMSRIVTRPEYRSMTIRNWNTTGKLLELMERMRHVDSEGARSTRP